MCLSPVRSASSSLWLVLPVPGVPVMMMLGRVRDIFLVFLSFGF
jgi:hypothetical protein